MKYLGIFTVILLFIPCLPESLSAQAQPYFPNTVMIKFETSENMRAVRARTGEDPRQRVRDFLDDYGTTQMQPLPGGAHLQRVKSRAAFGSAPSPADELSRIYQVHYLSGADPAVLAAKLSRMPGVEYAEPKFIRHMQAIPNDTIGNSYAQFHNFADAWDITRGDPKVVIAIVDGGVGYTHQELDEKMWINQEEIPAGIFADLDEDGNGEVIGSEILQYLQQNNEDYNGDGIITLEDALHLDSPLTTGSDTDGNGFEDDLFGWNFWASGGPGGSIESNNNPAEDATSHGTHVAGIAAAETNNVQGMYAAGYNVRYMAVKAGGPPRNPTAIGFGFEGIQYAALAGADIINCSWGGPGLSQVERDVIEFAVSEGALVVAAAGNESVDEVIYPAAFRHVLGVGAVETNDQLAGYSNYGYTLDVLATGTSIQSTVGTDNEYAANSGTSMATPVVSGLAGLIKSANPGWSPLRIATQIRATSNSIANNNTQRPAHTLGKGKIDAFEAVNTEKPGLLVESVEFVNQDGEKLALGEEGFIQVTAVNYGLPTGNLTLNVESLSEGDITLSNSTRQLGAVGTDDSIAVSFSLVVQEGFDLNSYPIFRLNMEDDATDYSDFAILEFQNFLFDVMNANNVTMSFGGDGTIGFTELDNPETGVGFVPGDPEEEENLLFEGGLMMLANEQVFDAVRSTDNQVSRDFQTEQVFRTRVPATVSDQDGYARFSVTDSATGTHATIDMETYAFGSPGIDNVVYLKYTITNTSEFIPIRNMYIGVFNDWDIGTDPANNGISFNSQDSILYVFDETAQNDHPLVAAAHLGPISSILGINNAQEGRRDSVIFGLYDGFTDEEKRLALQAGVANTVITGRDVSAVTGSGPYTLDPRASVVVGFVYAFGEDADELSSQVQNARAQAPFESSAGGRAVSEVTPPVTRLFQNYPNPFSGATTLRLDLQEASDVNLTLYDVLGRKVQVLVDRQLEARTHIFTFASRRLSSGVYFLRLRTEEGTQQTIPMTLIK